MMSDGPTQPGTVKRLNKVNERMKDGQDEWNALAAEKIISQRDANALKLSADGETQAWLLRWSAVNRQQRLESRAAFLTRLVIGAFNIAIAMLVALTCISVFMTLIKIISSMQ
jgi:type II secretory pathway component PulF